MNKVVSNLTHHKPSCLGGCPDKEGLPADCSGPSLLRSGLSKVWVSVPALQDLPSQL